MKHLPEFKIRRFIREIRKKFPDVIPLMERHEIWALTFRMGEFANLTSIAFNDGDLETAKSHLHYMSEKLNGASEIEFEYIDVYYVEHLFWKSNQKGIDLGWPLVPENLKQLYLSYHGKKPEPVRR
ncbi:DUF7674 family protein [Alteromonas ponticola]|uniref:DUF7674 domain-containing protein n=1 Tax=Alteromonas ponticola TaxID=2720613 RepID=A0ABX1R2K2_9ALTE|nr:hypothetical protein [Alteromonas ponticola]NMH60324.1 hypothetical protein [Alteromonas ponticola]